MKKYYRIAGLNIIMDTFGKTEEHAEAYCCEPFEETDICVQSNVNKWKTKFPFMSEELCEYKSTETYFYVHLLDFCGIKLHSSAVVVDGKAYLFSAMSGTGKSTHTQLWLKLFGDSAYILNDDKPALRLINGVWYAYGTPWSGKHNISVNKGVPLAGIAMLEQSKTNEIVRVFGTEAIFSILSQTHRYRDKNFRIKLMEILDDLVLNIPIWKLKCNMDLEAAIVSYEAMSGEKYSKEN